MLAKCDKCVRTFPLLDNVVHQSMMFVFRCHAIGPILAIWAFVICYLAIISYIYVKYITNTYHGH